MYSDGPRPGKNPAPVTIELAAHFKAPALSGIKRMSEGQNWTDLGPFEQGALINLVETLSDGKETLWPRAAEPRHAPRNRSEELHF